MAAAIQVENIVTLARILALSIAFMAAPAYADVYALVVSGLGGEDEYERDFAEQANRIATASAAVTADRSRVIELTGERARRDTLQKEFRSLAGRVQADDQVIVTVIGHGTFDGDEYRLALPGPDITGKELGALLDQLSARQQLIVNATSASGAVIERWKRPGRVLITATRSGNERNATRFAQFWAEALSSAEADRDKNEVITAAEAFDFASRKVADAFKSNVALATEHSRLEGQNASRFFVARLGKAAPFATDPELSAMMGEQAGIEQQLEDLKARKAAMTSDVYYNELEKVLIAIARLQRRIDARQKTLGGDMVRNPDDS